jgi:hypothetical protein
VGHLWTSYSGVIPRFPRLSRAGDGLYRSPGPICVGPLPCGQTGCMPEDEPPTHTSPSDLVIVKDPDQGGDDEREAVEQPAKVMRIGSMIKQLLEEVRQAPLDEASRTRLREIYDTSVAELADGLSPDLRDELQRMTTPFAEGDVPSEGELRVAQAQLVGWLEGLFHGIQATLFAQQMAARAQLNEMRQRSLPAGGADHPPGTYL